MRGTLIYSSRVKFAMCANGGLFWWLPLGQAFRLLKVFILELLLLQSDVNSVCFADETGHLIYSGSDDNLCKVNLIPLPF